MKDKHFGLSFTKHILNMQKICRKSGCINAFTFWVIKTNVYLEVMYMLKHYHVQFWLYFVAVSRHGSTPVCKVRLLCASMYLLDWWVFTNLFLWGNYLTVVINGYLRLKCKDERAFSSLSHWTCYLITRVVHSGLETIIHTTLPLCKVSNPIHVWCYCKP